VVQSIQECVQKCHQISCSTAAYIPIGNATLGISKSFCHFGFQKSLCDPKSLKIGDFTKNDNFQPLIIDCLQCEDREGPILATSTLKSLKVSSQIKPAPIGLENIDPISEKVEFSTPIIPDLSLLISTSTTTAAEQDSTTVTPSISDFAIVDSQSSEKPAIVNFDGLETSTIIADLSPISENDKFTTPIFEFTPPKQEEKTPETEINNEQTPVNIEIRANEGQEISFVPVPVALIPLETVTRKNPIIPADESEFIGPVTVSHAEPDIGESFSITTVPAVIQDITSPKNLAFEQATQEILLKTELPELTLSEIISSTSSLEILRPETEQPIAIFEESSSLKPILVKSGDQFTTDEQKLFSTDLPIEEVNSQFTTIKNEEIIVNPEISHKFTTQLPENSKIEPDRLSKHLIFKSPQCKEEISFTIEHAKLRDEVYTISIDTLNLEECLQYCIDKRCSLLNFTQKSGLKNAAFGECLLSFDRFAPCDVSAQRFSSKNYTSENPAVVRCFKCGM